MFKRFFSITIFMCILFHSVVYAQAANIITANKYLNVALIFRDYINNQLDDSSNESDIPPLKYNEEKNAIYVEEDIRYSFDNGNLSAISGYITNNIDPQFDISRFKIMEITNAFAEDEQVIFGAVELDYKLGDFVTRNGYYVVVNAGKVDKIYINGDPSCKEKEILAIKEVDENVLKEMAVDNLKLPLTVNDEIIGQRILKKYDIEPYYVIITEINDKRMNIARGESFEYRP